MPRGTFEQPASDSTKNGKTDTARELQEHREEQEIASQIQDDQATSKTVEEKQEEENYDPIDYLDDYNPMNTHIIIDLPWPQAVE
ncbi:unnamed protein product [Rotaria sordida]|uniref:Uncharacterized protein n=1 Tax=Rotaria sordida TaxID=392033 RepID=A0A815BHK3_9BILA|nr:unnamed protein product [Rotaria sordida]CAF3814231.1 unnamed protein product [Rotaria sordida]